MFPRFHGYSCEVTDQFVQIAPRERVREASRILCGKSYIFTLTWNKTYAIELGFKMLTGDIMNLIEKWKYRRSSSASHMKANNFYDEKSTQAIQHPKQRYHRPVTPAQRRNRDDDRPNRASSTGYGGKRKGSQYEEHQRHVCRHTRITSDKT